MSVLRVNEQVIHRQPVRNRLSKVRLGTILAFKDEGRVATVSFPAESVKADIPVEKLESVQNRFGRAVVQWNAAIRGIYSGR